MVTVAAFGPCTSQFRSADRSCCITCFCSTRGDIKQSYFIRSPCNISYIMDLTWRRADYSIIKCTGCCPVRGKLLKDIRSSCHTAAVTANTVEFCKVVIRTAGVNSIAVLAVVHCMAITALAVDSGISIAVYKYHGNTD